MGRRYRHSNGVWWVNANLVIQVGPGWADRRAPPSSTPPRRQGGLAVGPLATSTILSVVASSANEFLRD